MIRLAKHATDRHLLNVYPAYCLCTLNPLLNHAFLHVVQVNILEIPMQPVKVAIQLVILVQDLLQRIVRAAFHLIISHPQAHAQLLAVLINFLIHPLISAQHAIILVQLALELQALTA